jgi:hypothetical protein
MLASIDGRGKPHGLADDSGGSFASFSVQGYGTVMHERRGSTMDSWLRPN